MLITWRFGQATCAPIAAGRPKPIAPKPDEDSQLLGFSKSKNCAAHIWCCPTPTEKIASLSERLLIWWTTHWGTICPFMLSKDKGNSFFHALICFIQGLMSFFCSTYLSKIFSACFTSPWIGTSTTIFLLISVGSISIWINFAFLQNSHSLPVTLSSKRTPIAITRSAWLIAILAYTAPCIPNILKDKGSFEG